MCVLLILVGYRGVGNGRCEFVVMREVLFLNRRVFFVRWILFGLIEISGFSSGL